MVSYILSVIFLILFILQYNKNLPLQKEFNKLQDNHLALIESNSIKITAIAALCEEVALQKQNKDYYRKKCNYLVDHFKLNVKVQDR